LIFKKDQGRKAAEGAVVEVSGQFRQRTKKKKKAAKLVLSVERRVFEVTEDSTTNAGQSPDGV